MEAVDKEIGIQEIVKLLEAIRYGPEAMDLLGVVLAIMQKPETIDGIIKALEANQGSSRMLRILCAYQRACRAFSD
jgi:hypothetical protein